MKEMSNVHLDPLTVSIHVEKKGGFVEVGIAIECHVCLDKGNTGVDGERHLVVHAKAYQTFFCVEDVFRVIVIFA